MQQKFKVDFKKEDETLYISFFGALDEDADLSQVPTKGFKKVVLNLDKLLTLNSVGLMGWVNLMRAFGEGTEKSFQNCHRAVLQQVNVLNGFLPLGSVIESIYVPYECEECGHTCESLNHRGGDYMESIDGGPAKNNIASKIPCTECGEEMSMDVMQKLFFKFLEIESKKAA